MAQQTAVDFLIESIDARNLWTKELREEAQQAKEMEKQQMIKFANDYLDDDSDMNAEKYYTETFGKWLS